MAIVLFYEKPGCINNTKQKNLLTAAGHEVKARNLLTHPWHKEELRRFFGDRPVKDWFNVTAPAIKASEVKPENLSEDEALALMVEDPLLIRRPLMQVEDQFNVGFDVETIEAWIGLSTVNSAEDQSYARLIPEDLETCPQSNS